MSAPVAEHDWVSAHLFHGGDLDPVVVDAVGPITRRLTGDGVVDRWFFLRYWDGGQHVRLRVLPSPGQAETVRAAIAEHGGRVLGKLPATTRPSQPEYLAQARKLATWEALPGFHPRQYPDHSVEFIDYRREHDRYGHGEAMLAAERHFAESSGTVLTLLCQGADTRHRTIAALSAIALAWFACQPDVAVLTALARAQDRVPVALGGIDPAELNRRYESQRPMVEPLVAHCRAIAAGTGTGGAGTLADWSRSVHRLRDALVTEVAAGRFEPPVRGWEGGGALRVADPGLRVLPVLDICAHLFCNRLGVGLLEEAFMRYLLVRTLLSTDGPA